MAEKGNEKKADSNNGGSKRLSRAEYDKLVQGVDDVFFGGVDEAEGEKKPPPEKPAGKSPKSGDGDK
jgi:hypothetical protein